MPEGLPNEELLESIHSFPCPFRFKVIGEATDHFVGRVLAVFRDELPDGSEPPFSTRKTTAGRHVCVTIEPVMQTSAHVISVYARLRELEGLVMLL